VNSLGADRTAEEMPAAGLLLALRVLADSDFGLSA
jgi:hypothetical protein